ncbi:MAG: hypothetical protein ABSG42_00800, partial [Nitrospirota bacterium]
MRQSLLKKFLLAYFVMLAVAVPLLWLFLSNEIATFLINRVTENLKAEASILARGLDFRKGDYDLEAKQFKRLTGARATIIGPTGTVLGDSDENYAVMENHLY